MSETDLKISRLMKAPRAKVWKAWSDPAHLVHWWCPKPWTTEVLEFDMHPGGGFHTLMRGPNPGETSDNPGCFLEVIPMERIVTTSTLLAGYRPASPWLAMTAIITLADEAGGTRYEALVLHKDAESAKQHADMGFFEGWGTCMTQLDEYAGALR